MTKTQTDNRPNLFLKAFAVVLAITGAILLGAVLTGTFQNI